jgi:hypothetical protein
MLHRPGQIHRLNQEAAQRLNCEQHDILTAQKIAKFLCGSDGKQAGTRIGARYVQQSLHYPPMFKLTLKWMLDEKLFTPRIGQTGRGR